jgi:hypothetical protein
LIRITDNFLDDDSFDAIGETSMVYSKVQWVGRHALSENPFHDLVYKVFRHEWPDGHGSIKGATAWWNIRPVDPKPHSDLISYCTSGGVDYTPDNPPTRTFIYYLKAPENGGHLNIYTKPPLPNNNNGIGWKTSETDSISPIPNRLVSFPIKYIHRVAPYHGNRVSIGMIFWNELPSIYKASGDFDGQTNSNYNTSFDRPWEKEENLDINRKLTEDHIMGHPI